MQGNKTCYSYSHGNDHLVTAMRSINNTSDSIGRTLLSACHFLSRFFSVLRSSVQPIHLNVPFVGRADQAGESGLSELSLSLQLALEQGLHQSVGLVDGASL